MTSVFDNALIFLIETLFNIYILILMLRIVLQWAGAKYYNPISQFVTKLTNPIVKPLRQLIPPVKGIDLASLVILVALEFIKFLLIIWLKAGAVAGFFGLLIMAFGDILDVILNIFFWAILINALLSWFSPQPYSPITEVLYLITEPLLRPARNIIPSISGIDISPVIVLIILQLCTILIAAPLMSVGLGIALR